MRFSPALPTCGEGLGHPIGFATPDGLTRITERAEALGYFAVVPNDHLCTPHVLRDDTQRHRASLNRWSRVHRWRRGLAAFDCCQASSSCHSASLFCSPSKSPLWITCATGD